VRAVDGKVRHVLFLNWRDTGHPEGGGSEVYVERVARELTARGHRVTVVCSAYPGAPRTSVEEGVHFVRGGGRRTVYLQAALTYLAGALRLGPLRHRPDVIVDVGNGVPFLAPLWARRPVIALVHHVHREQWPVVLSPRGARFGWWIESRLAPWTYRRCRYVTVSGATRDELATLGVDRERITVIHNGTPQLRAPADVRSAHPSLVALSRLVPHKRIETALHALAKLSTELPDLELVVAGHGWWEERLRRLTHELGVQDRVRFVGFVDDADKAVLLARAWVALTPSLKEGWGLTIVEAGAMGTPTVAFRHAGGVAEAVLDGTTGLLADDEEDFVARVRHLLTDHDDRRRMGSAARIHAGRFTWTAAGDRFEALLREISA
jgi:glycosyltransferase involved in cell wall biosynthesis